MPKPRSGESKADFISRCMGYADLQDREPKQRAAICYSLWRSKSYHRFLKQYLDEGLWQRVKEAVDGGTMRVDGWRIKLVDGDDVKLRYSMDFVEGDNPEHSSFVPNGEIWVDRDLEPHEVAWIAFHEIVEAGHMARGMSYDDAHEIANQQEALVRRRFPSDDA